jgi:predicted DNA-binding transcriptional regulator AlpA
MSSKKIKAKKSVPRGTRSKPKPRRRKPVVARRPLPPLPFNPLAIFRTSRVAQIFDCDASTIWRWWAKLKILPPPTEFSPGVSGWTGQQISEFQESRPLRVSESADA